MTKMSPVEARDRVAALLDEGEYLHGALVAGEDEQDSGTVTYVLAVIERKHEGETYLNERYAMLPEDSTGMSDTFLKNGINRRFKKSLAHALGELYSSIPKRRFRAASDDDGELKPRVGVLSDDGTVEYVNGGDN